jgi:hypothetical protein
MAVSEDLALDNGSSDLALDIANAAGGPYRRSTPQFRVCRLLNR